MDNIKIIPADSEILTFSFHIPSSYHPLNINVFDVAHDDLLLHIDFRYPDNKIVLNTRINHQWGEEVHYDFDYSAGQFDGQLTITETIFTIEVGGLSIEIPNARSCTGRLLRLYSDFRFITLGSADSHTLRYGRRWPFFPEKPTPPATNTSLTRRSRMASARTGLCGLILFDGDLERLERFCETAASSFDELLLVIHDPAGVDFSAIRALQARHYHLRHILADQSFGPGQSSRKMKGSLFLNLVLAQVTYTNVMFVRTAPEASSQLPRSIRTHRLRTRTDAFCLLAKSDDKIDLQAFSVDPVTSFQPSESGSALAPEAMIGRHVLFSEKTSDPVSLDWSIDTASMFSGDGSVKIEVRANDSHNGRSVVLPPRTKLLVLIISCRKNRAKQEALRQTWIKDLKTAGVEYRFVEGDPSHEVAISAGDRLLVPAPDTYEFLSHKIWQAMTAANELFGADHVLKIDDDCIMNVPKFLEFDFESHDYMGTDISIGHQSYVDWHYGAVSNSQLNDIIFELENDQTWFDGQGSYILSRKAIQALRQSELASFQHMLEDYAVGRTLSASGINARRTVSSFQAIRDSYIAEDRDYERAVICDIDTEERMREVYDRFQILNHQEQENNSGIKLSVRRTSA